MYSFFTNDSLKNPYLKDATYTVVFGLLSAILSEVQFQIPGVGDSNLREIPLLMSLFHLSNPLFIFGLCLFTLIGAPAEISYVAVFSVHLIPLFIAWVIFKLLEKRGGPSTLLGVTWIVVTIVYYLILLLPLVIISLQLMELHNNRSFWESYTSILPSIRFEIVTSSLVTGFYLIQLEVRKTLEHSNRNLEDIVRGRTVELTSANNELQSLNEELKASNDAVKELNENLEKIVKNRTDKIQAQLSQLTKYAHMNSHEVRAPLARMLGLLQLINRENDAQQKQQLLDMLYNSSAELDQVIKEMNRLLEKEIYPYEED